MKKVLLSLAAIMVFTIGMVSCNSNSPKASADKFLTGLLHYDYEAAKSVSTEETKKMIDLMAQFSAMMPDSIKQAAKKVKVNIKDAKEEGDNATVTYTTSDDPQEKKLNLVKKEAPIVHNNRVTMSTPEIVSPYNTAFPILMSPSSCDMIGNWRPISMNTIPFSTKPRSDHTFTPWIRLSYVRILLRLLDKNNPPLTTASTPEK